jgi:hypothetical protein
MGVAMMKLDLFGFEIEPVTKRRWAERGEAQRWFDEHINDETDKCIIWPFNTTTGYGRLRRNGTDLTVSILVCEIRYGPKPGPDYQARHGPCQNRSCMNYRHLSWGTQQENEFDKIRDGTKSIGVKHPSVKLIEKEVIEICKLHSQGFSNIYIGNKYGVTGSAISAIIRGITWKHVFDPNVKLNGPDLFS